MAHKGIELLISRSASTVTGSATSEIKKSLIFASSIDETPDFLASIFQQLPYTLLRTATLADDNFVIVRCLAAFTVMSVISDSEKEPTP